jgi:formate/nitrite transporter FocA (FNT family)
MSEMWAILWVVCLCGSLLGGFVGVSLMLTAFGLIAARGNWQAAMCSPTDGKWSTPRKMMATGAMLNVLFLSSMLLLLSLARLFLFHP